MTVLAAGERGWIHDVQQTKQIVPFIFGETTFCENVSKLVLGVNMPNLDLEIKIDWVKQPIQSNSVGPRYMSHGRASSFHYHLDNRFVIFEHV